MTSRSKPEAPRAKRVRRLAMIMGLIALAGTTRAGTPTVQAQNRGGGAEEDVAWTGPEVASLVTVGPGESPVAGFGHSMILFEDPAGDTIAFSFGQSDYGRSGLLIRAMQGTVWAGAGRIDWSSARSSYLASGRTIWIQHLALSRDQVTALRTELTRASGLFPYATFDVNCTTTLRDALDLALGGLIRSETADRSAGGSLRDRVLPFVDPHPAVAVLSALFLTDRVDAPASQWEAMFLPGTLRSGLRMITVPGPDGASVPLVAGEEVVGAPPRAPSGARIPLWASALLIGTGLGASIALLGARAAAGRGSNRGFGALAAGWALTAGLIGVLLVLVGLGPDPAFSLRNENLFHLNPLWLGVAIAGWGSHPDWSAARRLAVLLVAVSILGTALELLATFDQSNAAVIAFALPANLGLAYGLFVWPGTRLST